MSKTIQTGKGASEMDSREAIRSVMSERADGWLRQISLQRASFEYAHRLKYSLDAQPCIIGGKQSLIIARDLEARDHFAYEHILRFAEMHDLQLVIDRRVESRSVDCERRAA